MDKRFTVWTNERFSNKVKAFKSALTYRTNETWEWVEYPKDAHLWVLDSFSIHDDSYELYQGLAFKPLVAVIDYDDSYALMSDWKNIVSPISVPRVLRWLDQSLPAIDIDTYRNSRPNSSQGNNDVDTPWKKNEFKLVAWPNISKFKSNKYIAFTCSQLLTDFYRFDDVLQWGLDDYSLNELLRDANEHELLQMRPIKEDNITSPTTPSRTRGGGQSLIQKLLSRFR